MKPPATVTVLRTRPALPGEFARLYTVLTDAAFVACRAQQETSAGWTRVDDLTSVDLLSGWLLEPWVCLGWREDRKTVHPAVVKMEADKLVVERQLKPNRHERKQLEENVRLSLLERADPTSITHTAVYWDTVRGELLIGSSSPKVVDAIAAAWSRLLAASEGVDLARVHIPRRVGPAGWIYSEPEDLPLCTALTGCDIIDENELVNGALTPEEAGRFLAWLWHLSESAEKGIRTVPLYSEEETLSEEEKKARTLGWIVRDGLSIADQDTGKRRMNIRAVDAQSDPGLRVEIIEGHSIDSVGLHVEHGGAWSFDATITAKEGHLVPSGIKLGATAGDPLVQAATHAALLSDVHSTLICLLGRYGVQRLTNWGQYSRAFRRWLGEEHRGWAADSGVDLTDEAANERALNERLAELAREAAGLEGAAS